MHKFDLPRRDMQLSSRAGGYSVQNSRISHSMQHRPIGFSPRGNDLRDRRSMVNQNDNKMRMFKSRVQNISINSRQGFGESNLFPE